MTRFKLYPDVFLVRGTHGAVLHDTSNQRAFALDQEYSVVLSNTEKNFSLDEVSLNSGIKIERVQTILDEIANACLGEYFEAEVYVEKIDTSPKWKEDLVFRAPLQIDRVFIQFGGECSLNCTYCKSEGLALSVSCWHCTPTLDAPIEPLEDAIANVGKLFPHDIVITCPPSVNMSALRRIVEASRKAASRVTVSSDCSLPFKLLGTGYEDLSFIFKLDLKAHSVSEVREWAVILPEDSIIQIILEDLHTSPDPYIDVLKDLGHQVAVAEVIKLGKHTVSDRVFSKPCNVREFSFRVNHNTCLATTLTIRSDGSVYQCPRLSSLKLADGFDLVAALRSEKYEELSRLSMNRIDPCCACEKRYLCDDCRYLEIASGASLEECVRCRQLM